MKNIRELSPWNVGKKVLPFGQGNPETLFSSLHRQMDHFFDEISRDFDLIPSGLRDRHFPSFVPSLDLLETDAHYQVLLELPGMSEKEIEISLRDGRLSIRGEKKEEYDEKKENLYRMERAYGTFQRTIDLPSGVREDEIEATFEKGVLKITLPKSEDKGESVRHIEVKAA